MSGAVFERKDEGFCATELARGPWDPKAQHGGAPAALLVRAFEQCSPSPDLALARFSYEFLRPVPLGDLAVQVELVRPGRRVQRLEASILTAGGTEVVRAQALRIRRAEVETAPEKPMPLAGPDQGRANDFLRTEHPMFATDAMEIRFVAGAFYEPGPATAWFRLRHPLLAGEETSPLQRLAAAGDFGNGISAVLSWDHHVFINPDLTLYVEREPVGDWIGLQSETRVASGGVGISESVLYDQRGRVGRATQALLVARR
jgi:hypothetical protein